MRTPSRTRTRNPGATPKRHALAVLKSRPGVLQLAGKRVVRAPDPKAPDGVRLFTAAEDLFTCFDGILVSATEPVLFVQWTSIKGVKARRDKVHDRFLAPLHRNARSVYDLRALDMRLHPEVWGWVKATGFRCWRWSFRESKWHECPMVASPLLKRPRRDNFGRRMPDPPSTVVAFVDERTLA